MEERPSLPPETDRVEGDVMRLSDGHVASPVGGIEDDLGPEGQLLRGRVAPDEGVEGAALLIG